MKTYADGAVEVHHADCLDVLRAMPDASVDSVVCDPPYGLADHHPRVIEAALRAWLNGDREHVPDGKGFMGREWDRFVPPPAVWDECLRVLKPGGHLLAFAAPRTADLMTMSIRLAGFEIRDSINWVFAQGFPKGQDLGKSIDRMRADRADVLQVTAWLNAARLAAGVTHKQIDTEFGFNGMASHWTTLKGKAAIIPTDEQWDRLQLLLGFGDEMTAEVRRLNARKGSVGENFAAREVIGSRHAGLSSGNGSIFLRGASGRDERGHVAVTSAASEAAHRWQGWNTTLKPAHEPIVVARKSTGFNSVVANVLEHDTGGLNIDGCRIPGRDRTDYGLGIATRSRGATFGAPSLSADFDSDKGRWPTNVVMSHAPLGDVDGQVDGDACVAGCVPGCPVAEVDQQSGTTTSRSAQPRSGKAGAGWRTTHTGAEYDDAGGASRFLPVFRFETKASSGERPRGVDGTRHVSVKPLGLIRWLVRLVTPPGGTVVDPFLGSGTTAEACVIEGFRCIGMENHAPYLSLIDARLSKPLQPALDLFGGAA
ncbi:DNA methyltransferase [Micromonospora sp. NPDC048986]|uniref:DNA methyltransferase n=1 Tax=Micromonospora sp. NPDC048986 TaxID=3155644 RepID=UPI0033F9481B